MTTPSPHHHTVSGDQPGPGEEYIGGAGTQNPTPPRQAATVILLRGGDQSLELLLVKRTPHARFMGGVWVFPGGAVEQAEGEDDRAHRAAAVRELHEEAGVELPHTDELVKFSRWITPAEVRTRFDTHFFLAPLPPGQEPQVDGEECVELGWFTPAGALDAHSAGEILLVFPTIKHLEQLAPFPTAAALLEHARGRSVQAVQPRVFFDGEVARVLLPGEPGY
ncbi:MAG TPA: NUDIX hydrolase [Solirubrobacteraceae bacterium]|jgi:8-oxo-dGTP pyrophosphatase MutT (NUDIX family)|nr:NUDIX hydrolase [Solirubrobacteraceae bacterium]